jgi:O-6-methylguanine DNA methyltransferase
MAKGKDTGSSLGVGALSTRMGWVGVVCSGEGVRALSLPRPSLDEAIEDCLVKAGQVLSEGERNLMVQIVERGAFVPEVDGQVAQKMEAWLATLAEELTRFYDGEETHFDVPLDWAVVSAWPRQVLEEVGKIPWGETRSYGWVAARLGNSKGARAVGAALSNNPFPPIVPCHRIIRADSSLGGFGGGMQMKRTLLEREVH